MAEYSLKMPDLKADSESEAVADLLKDSLEAGKVKLAVEVDRQPLAGTQSKVGTKPSAVTRSKFGTNPLAVCLSTVETEL